MKALPLEDIQGFVLRGYNLPYARHLLVELSEPSAARKLVGELLPETTTAVRWTGPKPASTVNVGFTGAGLEALGIAAASLASFPVEFTQGMRARAELLGDTDRSAPERWDPAWRNGSIHAWLGVNARSAAARDERCDRMRGLASETGGARVIHTQDAQAVFRGGEQTTLEHFGYADEIGNPRFEGDGTTDARGRGKLTPGGDWVPLATGELILGYPDEGGELPPAPVPHLLSRNGSFMVYRKLHENVASFRRYLDETARTYPGGKARLAAKLVGRWRDGTPLERSPHAADEALARDPDRSNDFTYRPDPDGLRCPLGAHIRRMNPRDTHGFDGRIANRHRLARRGMPYGEYVEEGEAVRDEDERGVVFIGLAASLERQFEFVQRHWVNHGDDARQGDDKDPLVGAQTGSGRFMIQGTTDPKDAPFMCTQLPTFVELRGGAYFFVPSLTALRLIAAGHVDPR